ncbi:hypothetical protein, partial [Nocardia brasiliensis]|uniref:hypothetical protein n=1 Tax=Nocardia brasiliensis TaxID=37326 RepID=UPI0024582C4E
METETDTATDGLAADPTSPFVLSPDFYRDPQGAYGALRARGPVNRVVFPDGSTGWCGWMTSFLRSTSASLPVESGMVYVDDRDRLVLVCRSAEAHGW